MTRRTTWVCSIAQKQSSDQQLTLWLAEYGHMLNQGAIKSSRAVDRG